MGSDVALDDEDAAHLRVLRLRPGATLRGVDGAGGVYRLLLQRLDRDGAVATIVARAGERRELPIRLWLIQSALHTPRADSVVEKAAEIGAAGVVFAASARSLGQPPSSRIERWRRIARSATLQSLGAVVPEIIVTADLAGALQRVRPERLVLADPDGAPLSDEAFAGAGTAAVLVGPEGGFTEHERQELRAAGACPVTLGPRRLRAETAATVLLALAAERLLTTFGPRQ